MTAVQDRRDRSRYNFRMEGFTIGQLAEAARVPTTTVRYYERNGLLRPSERSRSNYRLYDAQALERLRFIRAAQATGFSLDGVAELLKLTDESHPCESVQELINSRLVEVREKIQDLRTVEKQLTRALTTCCKGEREGLCGVIGKLKKS